MSTLLFEIQALEIEYNKVSLELDMLFNGFESINDLYTLIEGHTGEFTNVQKNAYASIIQNASIQLGATSPCHVPGLPVAIDTYTTESLTRSIKEMGDRFWKVLSDSYDKLATIVMSWMKKVGQWLGFSASKIDKEVSEIKRMLDQHEKIGADLGLRHGDAVTTDMLKMLKETYGTNDVMFTSQNSKGEIFYISREQLERDLTQVSKVFEKEEMQRAMKLFVNPKNKDSLGEGVADVATRVKEMSVDNYTAGCISDLNALVNIQTKVDFDKYLDNHSDSSFKNTAEFLKNMGITNGKFDVDKEYRIENITGSSTLSVMISKAGTLYFPNFTIVRVDDKVSLPEKISIVDLGVIIRTVSDTQSVMNTMQSVSDRLHKALTEAKGNSGAGLRAWEKRISSMANARDGEAAGLLVRDAKKVAEYTKGWQTHSKSMVTILTEIAGASDIIVKTIRKGLIDSTKVKED